MVVREAGDPLPVSAPHSSGLASIRPPIGPVVYAMPLCRSGCERSLRTTTVYARNRHET